MQKLAATLFTSHMASAHGRHGDGGIFNKLHAYLNHAEEVIDKAQPIFEEIHADIQDFKETVHEKAEAYHNLFDELKHQVKEESDIRGNLVSSTIGKNDMGCTVEESVYDNMHVETKITAPSLPYVWDYEQ